MEMNKMMDDLGAAVGPYGSISRSATEPEPEPEPEPVASDTQLMDELFAHFDEDSSGVLDFDQFFGFYKALDSKASLSQEEWVELCGSLEVSPDAGLGREHFEVFFEGETDTVRRLHERVVVAARLAKAPCPVCGRLPTEAAGGARLQTATDGCLCRDLREEFGGSAPALLKFGKMKGRSLMDIYYEEPDYMRWLVENATSATSPSETDRFLARVVEHGQHYLRHYYVEKAEPELQAFDTSDPMDRLTRQRHGTIGMDRMTEYDGEAEE